MNFGIYSYTATVLIFCGLAFSLYLIGLLLWKKSAMLSAGETWVYNPERTLNTTFLGAEVETYLFIILVSLVVSIATLVYARREDRKRNPKLSVCSIS